MGVHKEKAEYSLEYVDLNKRHIIVPNEGIGQPNTKATNAKAAYSMYLVKE